MDGILKNEKWNRLEAELKKLGSVAVAFSGGVDSTFLLYAAKTVLGAEHVLAVTIFSDFIPERELLEARQFCRDWQIRQIVCQTDVLAIPGVRENPKNRCYLCKRGLFSEILKIAGKNGLKAVAEGSNVDDLGDYRPGMQAIAELGIHSPLRAAGLCKADIRALSKAFDLPTWEKPSFACLASRFAYGEPIGTERLKMVERAEQMLFDLGFSQFRVRIHGTDQNTIARIELLPEAFEKIMVQENREKIYAYLKGLGFAYVTLDLGGYRTGSMNETLDVSL